MPDTQTPALRSSLGLIYWAGSLILGGLLLGCLLELFSPVQTPLQLLADVVLFPLAALLLWLFLTWLTLRVDLYEDHLQTRSIWGRRRLEWRHAASLKPTWDSLGALSFMQYLINNSPEGFRAV